MKKTPTDFLWKNDDEPHAARRSEILKKYPEIQKLYGYDSFSPFKVFFCVALQILSCYFVQSVDWWVLILLAYAWGGTINHSLMLAVHELSHDLFFPKTWQNEWFGIFTSLPLSLPISLGFKKYHLQHHLKQGIFSVDPDLPTSWEGRTFTSVPLKLLFLLFQPLFYVLRPLITIPKTMQKLEFIAWIIQICFDLLILTAFNGKALWYLLLSTLLGSGIHPLAAHFVAEHYTWDPKYETYSYYGPLNYLVYNVGWHNEHHDFPRIPGSRLPLLHSIAPEFYKDIGRVSSWPMILVRFVFDSSITPFSRVTRKKKGEREGK